MSMPNLADMVETNTRLTWSICSSGREQYRAFALVVESARGRSSDRPECIDDHLAVHEYRRGFGTGRIRLVCGANAGGGRERRHSVARPPGQDQYNVLRRQATYASCASTGFSVTTGTTAGGTFQAGQFHVANPTTGATYTNTQRSISWQINRRRVRSRPMCPGPRRARVPGRSLSSSRRLRRDVHKFSCSRRDEYRNKRRLFR